MEDPTRTKLTNNGLQAELVNNYITQDTKGFSLVYGISTPCRLFNAKSSLCIYIKYIGFVNTFC